MREEGGMQPYGSEIAHKLRKINLRHYDFWIFAITLALLAFGLIVLFSASAPGSANANDGDSFALLRSQLQFAAIGFAAMCALSFVPYRAWRKLAPIAFVVSIAALLLVFAPGFARLGRGTNRWIYLGSISFQPSEIAKFALITFLSARLAKRRDGLSRYWKGFVPCLLIIAVPAFLTVIEPHMSGAIFIVSVGVSVMFAAGARIRHFLGTAAVFGPLAFLAINNVLPLPGYVQDRIDSFLNHGQDALNNDWQLLQSLYAIGSGGPLGKGLTNSTQKLMWLPDPQNDFIFAVLAEELGFFGAMVAIALFAALIWRGVRVALMASDRFGCYMAIGITAHIGIQALANVAVVTGSMPVTGVSLPFFSSGGSSLCMFLAEVGVLLSISKEAHADTVLPASDVRAADRAHRRWSDSRAASTPGG